MRIHDISVPVHDQMVLYPGSPPTRIRASSRIADGDPANTSELTFGSHAGTHVDAAHHFMDGAQRADELPLELLIGPAKVVRIPSHVTAIGERELREAEVDGTTRLLLRTRNGDLLGQDEFVKDFAHLTGQGAEYLVACGVRLVAIDYYSVEAFDADEPRAHLALLEQEVIVVEGVDLRAVEPGAYELICLPLRIVGIDGAPARAVLRDVQS